MVQLAQCQVFLSASGAVTEVVNTTLCMICQKDDKLPVASEVTGRNSVKRAAEIRHDEVAKRLRIITSKDNDQATVHDRQFVYHNTNRCYKNYTHVNKLKSIENKVNRTMGRQH